MASRRDQVLDAAKALLVEHGPHDLTHRKVDARAMVPAGTTSNHFRSRSALVRAVLRTIIDVDSAFIEGLEEPSAGPPEEQLRTWMRARAEFILGPGQLHALIWYRFAIDGSSDPGVRADLAAIRGRVFIDGARMFDRFGSPTPDQHADFVLSYLGGLALTQRIDPIPDLDLARAVAPMSDGLAQVIRSGAVAPGETTASLTPTVAAAPADTAHAGPAVRGTRRDQVLGAALEVLVDRGGRGFTHRAVDAAAGVPLGTTSNFFRTRHDLLVGVAADLARRNTTSGASRTDIPVPADEKEFVRRLGELLRGALGPRRTAAIGHTILRFETQARPDLLEYVLRESQRWHDTMATWLAALGAPQPQLGARLIMSYLRAILLTEYAAPTPGFDVNAAVQPLALGLLHAPPGDEGEASQLYGAHLASTGPGGWQQHEDEPERYGTGHQRCAETAAEDRAEPAEVDDGLLEAVPREQRRPADEEEPDRQDHGALGRHGGGDDQQVES